MLTSNTKNIKLWKVFEKMTKKVERSAGKDLDVPKLSIQEPTVEVIQQ